MKTNAFYLLFLFVVSTVSLAQPTLWSTQGFKEPESVLAHPTKAEMYVSNMEGGPLELDGKGYISLLSPDGSVKKTRWVEGLDAPKGMGIYKNLLYVADLIRLRVIDLDKGVLLYSIEVHGSKMLNDVAVSPSGTVYVSDMLNGGVYRLKDNHIEKWVSTEAFPHPNGLYYENDALVIATWGEGIQDDFTTTKLGSLYRVEEANKKVIPFKNAAEFGNLDGIARIGDSLYISDWINGNVFRYHNNQLTLLFNAGKNAADISSRGNELLVPMMFGERLDSYKIN